jgi:hypothetical protein
MSSIKISAIDADWLAENVNGKVLLKAVEKLLGKKRTKKSSDGASVSSREMNPAMRAHLDRTTKISALLRQFKEEVKAGEREFDMDDYPKGIHLRVVSYLESEGTAEEIIEGAEFKEAKDGTLNVVEASEECMDAIEAAVNFLVENPDWKREAKAPAKKSASAAKGKSKGKEIDLSDSESEDEAPKAKKSVAKKEEKPKKAAAPKKAADSDSDSDSEDEKPVAKPAAKSKGKEVVLSDSEDEAPKVEAKSKGAAAKPEDEAPKKAAAKPKDEKPKVEAKSKGAAAPAEPKAKTSAKPKAADSESEDEKPKVKKAVKKQGGGAAAGGAVHLGDMVKVLHEERGNLFWDQEGDHSLYDDDGNRVGSTEDGREFVFA